MAGKQIYLDTSVYGGYFDKEMDMSLHTRKLFDLVTKKNVTVLTSSIVQDELINARPAVRKLLDHFSKTKSIPMSAEVYELAELYITKCVLPHSCYQDARHIAAASIAAADMVVSWNMKHMVRRQKQFNEVNLLKNYKKITIITPEEANKSI